MKTNGKIGLLGMLLLATAFGWWFLSTEDKMPHSVAGERWTNSLGQVLAPVAGVEVLFGIWDVRMKDYAVYADANSGVDSSWRDVQYKGERVSGGPDHPVTMVSWEDAKAFCGWLTKKEREDGLLSKNQSYRLPTDAEWSVAVGLGREDGKTSGVYPWGNQWPPPSGAGNYADQTAKTRFPDLEVIEGYDDGFATTSPVGSLRANRHGLCDMGGNVWQWCEDWSDGGQKYRVVRGASWRDLEPDSLLSSSRDGGAPDTRSIGVGFRVVLAGAFSR